jgi:hypothetical protein
MRSPFVTAIAIAFGLMVLISYFIPANTTIPNLPQLRFVLGTMFINGAATLAGFVTLIAVLGLVSTHWNKLRAKRNPDRYSIFMLLAFVVTLFFGIYAYASVYMDRGGSTVSDFQKVVTAFQAPVETSLMALLAVTLTLAGLRLFQRRRGLLAIAFFISVLVFLLLNSGLLASQAGFPMIGQLLAALRLLPVAGGRGILLGIALGSLMAGLRILLGADRPYSG